MLKLKCSDCGKVDNIRKKVLGKPCPDCGSEDNWIVVTLKFKWYGKIWNPLTWLKFDWE